VLVKRYKLKLTSLKFISPVDAPAQETATALLLKRAGVTKAFARVVKTDPEQGLVFCWAFTTKLAGEAYHDLHGDAIEETDLVKVCAEFMAGARAVDEMHDGEQTGQVIFGMPLTAEVAKAFGVETDTEGFMVAIKPAPDVFAKFKSGEYTGVSIEGTGIREEISLVKRACLTTAAAGHTHMISGIDDAMCGSTSNETMPGVGADYYGRWHSHPWIRGEDGSITIGEQEGHTHEMAGSSSSVKRAPEPVASGKSTTAPPAAKVSTTTQESNQMSDTATLRKQLSIALTLTDAQRLHAVTLDDAERDTFLAKSAGDRETIVKAAQEADPVLYTRTDGTGAVIRKSQGQLLADVAKQADQAMALAAGEVAKRQDVELQKRADTVLKHFAKPVAVRAAILKAVDGIADEKVRAEALESLAGADAACAELAKAQGVSPGGEPVDEVSSKRDELRRAVEAFAKANGSLTYEAAFVKAISGDQKIRDLYESVQNAG
jgi:hypothetical protein